jgi:lysophospholipase L1-like esterase
VRTRPLATALVIAWATIGAGCGSPPVASPPHVAPAPAPPAPSPVADVEPTPAPPAPPAPAPGPPFTPKVPELAHFHEALWGLETRSRRQHARVVWLGDSHGQADFWSGRVRRILQQRFGDGGPGYVALGYKNYRHDRVAIDIQGKWRMRPKQPATAKPDGDGVFGLAGLLMGGYAGGPKVTLAYEAPPATRLLFDVCVKPRAAEDSALVQVGDKMLTVQAGASGAGKIQHLVLQGDASSPLVVKTKDGSPDYCGAVIETDPAAAPGVVIDQLGFNGARFGTPLAWDEAAWSAELARRAPELVILEFGGNEAGDAAPAVAKIGAQIDELVARVRRVRPDVDCLVVAPTDRADAEERVPLVVAAAKSAAARAKCAWFDAYAIAGGKGSAAARRDEPRPRVQKDGIHLTIRGYEEMGVAMAAMLLDGYEGPPGTAPTRSPPSPPSDAISQASLETPIARATPSR